MLRLKANKFRFELPQCWGEVTVGQYYQIIKPDNSTVKVVKALTGLPLEIIEGNEDSFVPYLQWIATPINIEGFDNRINIKEESCGKYFLFEQEKDKLKGAIKIYFPDLLIDSMPLSEALPISNDLYRQMNECHKWEADNLHFTATNEMKRAGIDKFNQFARTNTIDVLAGGDILKYEKVLEIDLNTIFAKLKRIKIENDFQKNYSKIMSEKK